jgi:gamma-glutamyl:cysteine ligase YbdK (ATP-grasp superfamily)
MPDQPTDVGLASAFAALVQALCAAALAGEVPSHPEALGDRGRGDYAQNRWAASLRGPRAELLHPDGGSALSAAALGAELLERVRAHADRLGAGALLDRIDPATCEGDRQLADSAFAAADIAARSLA